MLLFILHLLRSSKGRTPDAVMRVQVPPAATTRQYMSDNRSVEASQYRKLYQTARWKRTRHHQLTRQPLCEWCLEREIVEAATECHHKIPHRGSEELFWSGPYISTCKSCHASRGQREDRGQIVVTFRADGWPARRGGVDSIAEAVGITHRRPRILHASTYQNVALRFH